MSFLSLRMAHFDLKPLSLQVVDRLIESPQINDLDGANFAGVTHRLLLWFNVYDNQLRYPNR